MHDRDFLIWLLRRLVHQYGESPNVDFVSKLASIIDRTPVNQFSPNIAMDADIQRLLDEEIESGPGGVVGG